MLSASFFKIFLTFAILSLVLANFNTTSIHKRPHGMSAGYRKKETMKRIIRKKYVKTNSAFHSRDLLSSVGGLGGVDGLVSGVGGAGSLVGGGGGVDNIVGSLGGGGGVDNVVGSLGGGGVGNIDDLLAKVNILSTNMRNCESDIKGSLLLVKQNPSIASKRSFQKKVHAQVTWYRKQSADFPVLSAEMKSLHQSLLPIAESTEPDQYSELGRMLKGIDQNIVDTLADIDLMVYSAPILGNTLGPLVYDIKCVVEDVLNIGTNVLDGLLDISLLASAGAQAHSLVCKCVPTHKIC
ncbi:hypothetical protein BT69DRAFT_1331703 [Atractiella rhizophila]|nr:hypothetical protein BT69DRAFT_1331703 [Atractiella rhizophila]